MNRYLKSFIVTFAIYALCLISFLYSTDNTNTIHHQQTKSNQTVKFTIIQEAVQPILEEKKEIKTVKKQLAPKIKKTTQNIKPIIEQKLVKKTKKQIKKNTTEKKIDKQIAKKQIKKNNSLKKEQNRLTTNEVKKRKIQQQLYYTKIKELINKNKYYPRMAVKRGIEGMVKINFTISKKGELVSFSIIEGKRVFKKSILEAIKNSFPFPPPKGILTSNTNLSLKIDYRLY